MTASAIGAPYTPATWSSTRSARYKCGVELGSPDASSCSRPWQVAQSSDDISEIGNTGLPFDIF
ncbi:uncharacterized protein TRAVEDRAFT_40941 [Trametes versicolor FP-101664 SS1]|uniref:Uncharacterized protein n=1 Tax=Trametes versicolor (strain FP-101664) TaxID=717944 RepID=R7SA87_TRAVS|nr:uncharacterized protein TRAVEDRAFT_40941 [Trametes versicolor FP-101664 SS1]EIW51879.1 hypothetical protein TRAVEDRAFT_40941 [Trametes versicolor FP-101664 SS1]